MTKERVQNATRLLLLMLVFLTMQVSVAEACFMSHYGPTSVGDPDQVIQDAYFIGVVEIVSSEAVPNSIQGKYETIPILPYKKAPFFKKETISAIGREHAHSMCNLNTPLFKGSVEAIIMCETEKIEGKKWWQFWGADFEIKNCTISTDTFKDRWFSLRKEASLEKFINKKEIMR